MDRAPGVARIRCEEEGLITVRTFAVLGLHRRIQTFIPATTAWRPVIGRAKTRRHNYPPKKPQPKA